MATTGAVFDGALALHEMESHQGVFCADAKCPGVSMYDCERAHAVADALTRHNRRKHAERKARRAPEKAGA